MATWQSTETRKIAVGTVDTVENFTQKCTGCYLVATADCYVAFDENADTGSLLVKANQLYPLEEIEFTQIHAIRTGGAGDLHVLAKR